jgi:hypothetical protein
VIPVYYILFTFAIVAVVAFFLNHFTEDNYDSKEEWERKYYQDNFKDVMH